MWTFGKEKKHKSELNFIPLKGAITQHDVFRVTAESRKFNSLKLKKSFQNKSKFAPRKHSILPQHSIINNRKENKPSSDMKHPLRISVLAFPKVEYESIKAHLSTKQHGISLYISCLPFLLTSSYTKNQQQQIVFGSQTYFFLTFFLTQSN